MSGKREKKFSWQPLSWMLIGCAAVLANDGHVMIAVLGVALSVGYALFKGTRQASTAAQGGTATIEVAPAASLTDAGMVPSGPSSAEVMRTWLVLF